MRILYTDAVRFEAVRNLGSDRGSEWPVLGKVQVDECNKRLLQQRVSGMGRRTGLGRIKEQKSDSKEQESGQPSSMVSDMRSGGTKN
jgi:hypothetical protein